MAQGTTVKSSTAAPKRTGNGWLTGITVGITLLVGFTIGMVPVIGSAISSAINYVVERFSNHSKASKELDARADWYRSQIATTLGMDPAKVKGKHLEQAAAINPMLAAAVRDVRREEAKDNKTALITNGAVAMIPGGSVLKEGAGVVKAAVGIKEGLKHTGKILAATTAGGLLVSWTSKEHLSAQEVAEGISGQLEAAKAQGVDPSTVVTPQMVFTLRVAQDEALGKEIQEMKGNVSKKPFHKLNEQEQAQVMQAYGALANAATSEAYALANNMLPVQELMARAPNLNGTARYAVGNKASSFADRETSRREAAPSNVAIMRGNAANDANFAAAEEARRQAAAQTLNARQA